MSALYGDDDDGWTPTTVALVGLGVAGAAAAAFAGSAAITYAVGRVVGDFLIRHVTQPAADTPRGAP